MKTIYHFGNQERNKHFWEEKMTCYIEKKYLGLKIDYFNNHSLKTINKLLIKI